MSAPPVSIQQVSKVFAKAKTPSLENISAIVPKGEIVGLVGPDGAGKTTLIRLMAALLLPTKGSITVNGWDTVKDAEKIHSFIGYMPQKFGLYEDLTVQQNLNLYADLRDLPTDERKETFEKLLSFTTLAPFTNRLARNLSGGMKQKLGLACALIKNPGLLLLDEPSVGVDPISRRELWKMTENLLEQGISVVWSTAYLDEAERCHTVLLLDKGKLLFHGKPQEMTERVKGRTFKISHILGNRREVLTQALQQSNVMDGVIQGNDVRLLFKKKEDRLPSFFEKEMTISPCLPRFEDAYMDILGGGPGGKSKLAESTPQVDDSKVDMIEAKGLTKQFGSFTATDDVTFTVEKGEIFGLLGPNGAGKTTTFKMLCGLLKPTSGHARVLGIDLQQAASEARSHIGYMAQKFSLYGDLSVMQNLWFFSGVYNLKGKKREEIIDNMIHIFELSPFLDTSADTLPLGFKQRLALCAATMHHPEVLFLDEPTSGVDPITRREFWNHINGLVEKKYTVIVTTHFMDEAEYCDRIALVYKSKVIKLGTPDFLKESAKTEQNPSPSLEEAFIELINQHDLKDV